MSTLGDNIEKVLARAKAGEVIGVNGLDCAGKTTFANAMVEAAKANGRPVQLIHVDDFNNQETQKHIYEAHRDGAFGTAEFESYYAGSIHYEKLRAAIQKARSEQGLVIVEGVFLFKEALADLFDVAIFLTIETNVARTRYAKRKQEVGDMRPITVFDDIWVPAFERYCRENFPEAKADFVFQM